MEKIDCSDNRCNNYLERRLFEWGFCVTYFIRFLTAVDEQRAVQIIDQLLIKSHARTPNDGGNITLAVELKTLVSVFIRCTPGYKHEASFSPFIFVPSKRNPEVFIYGISSAHSSDRKH